MTAKTDRETFGQIFKSQYPRLYYYALQLIKDPEASRDIVSDVFTMVWGDFASYDLHTLPAFLSKTVRNRCLDHLRHETVRTQYADYYLHAVDLCCQDTPDSEERARRVDKMLALLPETTRHVLEECYLNRKKYREVAEEMNVCQETVKRHIMRALKLLREHCGKNKI